jgi:hypothetical protein
MPFDFSKSKRELIDNITGRGAPYSEQATMAVVVKCVEDLEKSLSSLEASMNKNAMSSDRLATKVFWLNVVLATATVIGTLLSVYQLFFSNKPSP